MATIAPFRGLRYNLKKVPSLTSVVAPPYDVINEEYRRKLAARDPHNCVKLILPQDSPERDRYANAAEAFKGWIEEGVLAQDKKPAIYVVSQEWQAGGAKHVRTGFIAAVKLEPFGKGNIYPHENTLSAPKEDRLKLVKATRANLSQVFGIVPDDAGDVAGWLSRVCSRPADAEATDDNAVLTRLWVETDAKSVKDLTKSMGDRSIFIADGHHRYETALNYQRFLKENGQETAAADSIMMLCVAMSDPGLITQPTHRLLPRSVAEPETLVERLKGEFDVLPFATFSGKPGGLDGALISDLTPNLMALYVGKSRPVLRVIPKSHSGILSNMSEMSQDWRALDVSILQYAILERILGLTLEHVTREARIGYEHDADAAMRRVDSGEFASAFILRPTPVSAVAKVASHLEKMPPKSTYFYPKALTGLVIRSLW